MDAIEQQLRQISERLGQNSEGLTQISAGLAQLMANIEALGRQRTVKDFYTTVELAKILNKAEFTVREWCRLGRIHAQKRACGRGPTQEWMISHEELVRYQNHGLLPVPTYSSKY